MRTNPAVRRAVELVADGAIGEVGRDRGGLQLPRPRRARRTGCATRHSAAAHCWTSASTRSALAQLLLGTPEPGRRSRAADRRRASTRRPGSCSGYPTGCARDAVGELRSCHGPVTATITGTAGRIVLPDGFYRAAVPDRAPGRSPATAGGSLPYEGNGLRFPAIEAGRCLRAGLAESPLLPLEDTLAVMRTMDVSGMRSACATRTSRRPEPLARRPETQPA